MVQHMVLIQFKPEVDQATIDGVFAGLKRLSEVIPGIRHFSGEPYASSEGLNHGLPHGCLTTFESPAARDNYLTHPEHKRLLEAGLPLVQNLIAFDYEA